MKTKEIRLSSFFLYLLSLYLSQSFINWSDLPPHNHPHNHHARTPQSPSQDGQIGRGYQSPQHWPYQNTRVESIHTTLTAKIDSLIERFASIPVPPQSSSPSPVPPLSPAHHHHMKLDVPCFDDSNPLGWIFKISQFFDYHGISH